MKTVKLYSIIVLILILSFLSTGNLFAEGIEWIEDYSEGLEEAKSSGKNMFILITAPSWCYWCQKLEEDTFSNKEVQDMINEAFIPVKVLDVVDGKRNPDLKHFNFGGYPTIFVFSEEEKSLHKIGGYVAPDALIARIEEFAIYDNDKVVSAPSSNKETINWVESWDDGFEMAKKENKKVFLLITAPSWCYWCQELEKNTLSKQEVIKKANFDFIPIRILDTNPDELEKVTIDFGGYPAMAFMEPDGSLIFKIGGFVEKDALLDKMDMALNYQNYLDKLEAEFEEVKDDEEKAYQYIDKLMTEELYEMAEEKSRILYNSESISDEYKEEFLFAVYVTKLMRDQLQSAIDTADEFIKAYPDSEKIELIKYYNILSYYYLADYDMVKKLAEEFKEEYPESEFISDIDEILNSIE